MDFILIAVGQHLFNLFFIFYIDNAERLMRIFMSKCLLVIVDGRSLVFDDYVFIRNHLLFAQ